MDPSVHLTEYSGLVNAVTGKLLESLLPQLGEGPVLAFDRAFTVSNQDDLPAERALKLRFALGGDAVAYLNNGVALLAAGTPNAAIDVSGLVGSNVLSGVRNAVHAELLRREERDKADAPRKLRELRELVIWLLGIPEVGQGVLAVDERRRVAAGAGPQVPHSLATIIDAMIPSASAAPAGGAAGGAAPAGGAALPAACATAAAPAVPAAAAAVPAAAAAATAEQAAAHLTEQVQALTRKQFCYVLELLLQMLEPSHGPQALLEGLFESIEALMGSHVAQYGDSQRNLMWEHFRSRIQELGRDGRGRVRRTYVREALDLAPDRIPVHADLQARYELLEQEIGAAVKPPATDVPDPPGVVTNSVIDKWYNGVLQGAQPIQELVDNGKMVGSSLAQWVACAGLVGIFGPNEKRDGERVAERLPYNMSVSKSLSIHPPTARSGEATMVDDEFESEQAERLRRLGAALGVSVPGCNVVEEAVAVTMKVRWLPRTECECIAAVLEHVIDNLRRMRTVNGGLGEPEWRILAGAAKLRQLEHLQRARTTPLGVLNEDLWTSNAMYTDFFVLPVPFLRRPAVDPVRADARNKDERSDVFEALMADGDAGQPGQYPRPLADADRDTDAYIAALNAAQEVANAVARFPGSIRLPPAVPSDSDILAYLGDVPPGRPEPAVTRKRQSNNTSKDVPPERLSLDELLAHVRNGVRLCRLLDGASSQVPLPIAPPPQVSGPERTRATLWNEMLREISISSDRLWVFVKLLSGAMGESAETLLTVADEAAQRAQKAFEEARKEIAEKTAAFHTKLVEVVVGGVLRGSKLEAIPDHENGVDQLFVADAELAKDLRALASGESGRPFFEANVAIQGVLREKNGKKVAMAELVGSLQPIVAQLQAGMEAELVNVSGGTLGLEALSAPRNSYMVSLRDDVVAALRIAYDRLTNELGSRRITLWELVEGASSSLSLRFAEFVAQVLVATRASSGTSAMYVSQAMIATNVLQARAALGRLVKEARGYSTVFRPPDFNNPTGRYDYFLYSHGKTTPLAHMAGGTETVVHRRVLVSSDVSGWQPGRHPYLR